MVQLPYSEVFEFCYFIRIDLLEVSMIELVFLTCLLSQPSECREREMIFYDVTMMSCMIGAQPELAKWAYEHPDWQITRWKCSMVQSVEADT